LHSGWKTRSGIILVRLLIAFVEVWRVRYCFPVADWLMYIHVHIQYIFRGISGGLVMYCKPQCFFFFYKTVYWISWQWFRFVTLYGRVFGYFVAGALASIVTSVAYVKEVFFTARYWEVFLGVYWQSCMCVTSPVMDDYFIGKFYSRGDLSVTVNFPFLIFALGSCCCATAYTNVWDIRRKPDISHIRDSYYNRGSQS
jgi:hypothetical protein